MSMDNRRYCVYNRTSKCFLSLGLTREDRGFAGIKGLLRGRAPRYDEGRFTVSAYFHRGT
jgi:hypothetical protein